VPFTLVHAGKYRTEKKLKIQTIQKRTKHNPEKANNAKYSKTKLPGSVVFYNTQPGNEMGLFYNTPEPTRGATTISHGFSFHS